MDIALCLLLGFFLALVDSILAFTSSSYILDLEKVSHKLSKKLRFYKRNFQTFHFMMMFLIYFLLISVAVNFNHESLNLFKVGFLAVSFFLFVRVLPQVLAKIFWKKWILKILKFLWILDLPFRLFLILFFPFKKVFFKKSRQWISRDELKEIIHMAFEGKEIEKSEYRMLKNMLRFKNIETYQIMTAREEIVLLPADISFKEAYQDPDGMSYSRLPIFGANQEDIIGYVLRSEIMAAVLNQEDKKLTLRDISRTLVTVPQEMKVKSLFNKLMKRGEHIAVAIDEYGQVVGLVTIEDIFENMLGFQIEDEEDQLDHQKLQET